MYVRRQRKVWFFVDIVLLLNEVVASPPVSSDATAYLKAALFMTFLCLPLSPLMWS
jgi:hypothetical protein